ncbi:hypothetical protein M405DRAFT_930561 [Rhizopogon salebrosus TDB-379]|nr:hypothetical protein M405DRAFT_930561 [Rhizopogon salebrosus TDB-379]
MSLHAGGESSPNATTRVREPSFRTEICNVVIFGETGAGKSSLVNLITQGRAPHEVSSDAMGRTAETTIHDHKIVSQGGTLKLKLFDTPGSVVCRSW